MKDRLNAHYYYDVSNNTQWSDTFATSIFVNSNTIIPGKIRGHHVSEIQKARKHPIVYTFKVNEYEHTNFWDDPELYERSFKNNIIPFAGSNWKGGETI